LVKIVFPIAKEKDVIRTMVVENLVVALLDSDVILKRACARILIHLPFVSRILLAELWVESVKELARQDQFAFADLMDWLDAKLFKMIPGFGGYLEEFFCY